MLSTDFYRFYQDAINKNKYELLYDYYVKAFVNLGYEANYFNGNMVGKIQDKLLYGFDKHYNSYMGDEIYLEGKELFINHEKLFKKYPNNVYLSEEYASKKLFYEFAHIINCFKTDMDKGIDGTLRIFCDDFYNILNLNFNTNVIKNEEWIRDRLDSYAGKGVIFLDKLVSQSISEDLHAQRYDKKKVWKSHFFEYANIEYDSTFSEYGLIEHLGEYFARSLADVNSLKYLCKKSLDDDFVEELISEHVDDGYNFQAFYRELINFGVIIDTLTKLEKNNGVAPVNNCATPKVFSIAYNSLLRLLSNANGNKSVVKPKIYINEYERHITW